MNVEQKRKRRIRTRDRARYQKTGRCFLCGQFNTTELHHRYYPDRYDAGAIIELCRECHQNLHPHPKPGYNHTTGNFKAPQKRSKSFGYRNRYALDWCGTEIDRFIAEQLNDRRRLV